MATLKKTRTAQWPLVQEFSWTAGDSFRKPDGTVVALNAAGSIIIDPISLPPGATVIGGELIVHTASNDAGTAAVSLGDALSALRYLAATDVKAAARTPLLLTGYKGVGNDVRMVITNGTGGATAGSYTVRVQYVIENRSNEVQPT
jgi:hypothetical protein